MNAWFKAERGLFCFSCRSLRFLNCLAEAQGTEGEGVEKSGWFHGFSFKGEVAGRHFTSTARAFYSRVYEAYCPPAFMCLIFSSSDLRLQSPGIWLGGKSFSVITNLLATTCMGPIR